MANLFDIHQELFHASFEGALPFESYVQTGTSDQTARWSNYRSLFSLTEAQRETISQYVRRLNILVLSGIWCGDCARQGPVLWRIAEASPLINLRFVESSEVPELSNELRIHGAARVPVVLFLSEDFYEVARFGDRTLAAYRRKAARELGPACDPGLVPLNAEEFAPEVQDWCDIVERAQILLRTSGLLRDRYDD